jgi:nucleoside triphosphate pyrophosphatase
MAGLPAARVTTVAPARLVLASASPRRADLLATAGFDFDVHPADVDETPRRDEPPDRYVVRLALDKLAAVAAAVDLAGRTILAADTTVVLDGRLLGKPADAGEAAAMLTALAGRTHEVITGLALRAGERTVTDAVTTRVRLLPLDADEVAAYVASGEPYGKAGAYAIQGRAARFVDHIEGSWSNVVGLPLAAVYAALRRLDKGV